MVVTDSFHNDIDGKNYKFGSPNNVNKSSKPLILFYFTDNYKRAWDEDSPISYEDPKLKNNSVITKIQSDGDVLEISFFDYNTLDETELRFEVGKETSVPNVVDENDHSKEYKFTPTKIVYGDGLEKGSAVYEEIVESVWTNYYMKNSKEGEKIPKVAESYEAESHSHSKSSYKKCAECSDSIFELEEEICFECNSFNAETFESESNFLVRYEIMTATSDEKEADELGDKILNYVENELGFESAMEVINGTTEESMAETFEARENKDGTIVLTNNEWDSCIHLYNGNYLWGDLELKLIDDGLKNGAKFKKETIHGYEALRMIHLYERLLRKRNVRSYPNPNKRYGAETFDDEKIRDWLKTNYMTFNELIENHYTYEGLMAWLDEYHEEVHEEWLNSNRMDAETFEANAKTGNKVYIITRRGEDYSEYRELDVAGFGSLTEARKKFNLLFKEAKEQDYADETIAEAKDYMRWGDYWGIMSFNDGGRIYELREVIVGDKGDFYFDAETFESEEDYFDCIACEKELSESRFTKDEDGEMCDLCFKTNDVCSVCQNIELRTDLHYDSTGMMKLCERCEKYDERYAESFEANAKTFKKRKIDAETRKKVGKAVANELADGFHDIMWAGLENGYPMTEKGFVDNVRIGCDKSWPLESDFREMRIVLEGNGYYDGWNEYDYEEAYTDEYLLKTMWPECKRQIIARAKRDAPKIVTQAKEEYGDKYDK